MPMTGNLAERLTAVRAGLSEAAIACGRNTDDVELLAVSKGHPAESIRQAAELGLRRFGESYLSDALPKIDALRDQDLEWFFLGPLQSNKTRPIAENFDWALGLCSEKIARRLDAQRPPSLPPMRVCIQVNVDGDDAKSGVRPEELDGLLDVVGSLPNLSVRGLMTIPRKQQAGVADATPFRDLATLFHEHVERGHRWDVLSMGMSGDHALAVAEGSTQVRIGTALFGPRPVVPEAADDRKVMHHA